MFETAAQIHEAKRRGKRLAAMLKAQGYSITSFAQLTKKRWHHIRDLVDGRIDIKLDDFVTLSIKLKLTKDEACWFIDTTIPGSVPPPWLDVDSIADITVGDEHNATP